MILSIQTAYAFPAAWMLPEGKTHIFHTFSTYYSSTYFDEKGTLRHQGNEYSKFEYNPLIEYGYNSNITLGVSPFFTREKQLFPSGFSRKNLALQSTELFVRQKLWEEGPHIVSWQPLIKLPSLFVQHDIAAPADKQWSAELRLLGGTSGKWKDYPLFANVESAFRAHTNPNGMEWRLDSTVGAYPTNRWMLLGQMFTQLHMNNILPLQGTPTNPSQFDAVKLQFSSVYALSKTIQLQTGVFQTVWGCNTGKGHGVIFSIWHSF